MSAVLAPGGWGFRPGAVLIVGDTSAADLPAIDGFDAMSRIERVAAVRLALRDWPKVSPAWVQHRYGLAYGTAHDIANKVVRGRGNGMSDWHPDRKVA